MKNMTLEAIANACNGEIYYSDKITDSDTVASQVIIDSRQIIPGGVFIATPGERVDGHSFIPQVFEKGALGVVCEKLPDEPLGPCILVKDSFEALRQIATYYRSVCDIKVVGVTGSVGKTSTKEFIASVLAVKYNTCKTQGNFNNEIGVPLTLLQVKDDTEVLVLEMGINHFGEMTRLTAMGRPDIAVITNIGQCHLEFLEDRDGVLRAKTEIFTGMDENAIAVLNGDDDKLITVKDVHGNAPLFFGRDASFPYYVKESRSLGLLGSEAVLVGPDKEISVKVPLPGEHMVSNALTAMAVADKLGLTADEIKEGIANVKSTGGRSNIISTDKYTIIDDCYNANPTSMKSAIELLCTADTSKVAILGDMFELGGDELKLHGEVGSFAATSGIDVLICIGKLSKAMYEKACEEQTAMTYYFEDIDSAMAVLKNMLSNGDSILIKASHSMGFEKIVDFLQK